MPLVPIILSGGAGARLWPLSRAAAPKPFLPLPTDGATGDSLLARTLLRATALPDVAGLLTITHRDYYLQTRDAYAGAGARSAPRMVYLLEPFARNTASAVALAAHAEAVYGPDATPLVLPADHLIRGGLRDQRRARLQRARQRVDVHPDRSAAPPRKSRPRGAARMIEAHPGRPGARLRPAP